VSANRFRSNDWQATFFFADYFKYIRFEYVNKFSLEIFLSLSYT